MDLMRLAAIFRPPAASTRNPRRWLRAPVWAALDPVTGRVLLVLAGVAALGVLLGAAR